MVLLKVRGVQASEARNSLDYYSFCLVSVLVWALAALAMQNTPHDMGLLSNAFSRSIFIFASLAVFFYATSSIYFTRAPHALESLVSASPLILILIANVIDPFPVMAIPLGWYGTISNPFLNYLWLGLVNVVVGYALVRLFRVRSRVRSPGVRRRLTYFMASVLLALVSGVSLYLISQVLQVPALSVVAAGFSFLLAYRAFTPEPKRPRVS